jgi:hypothetical protein
MAAPTANTATPASEEETLPVEQVAPEKAPGAAMSASAGVAIKLKSETAERIRVIFMVVSPWMRSSKAAAMPSPASWVSRI